MSAYQEALEADQRQGKVWYVRNKAVGLAKDCGCGADLRQALLFCLTHEDLLNVAKRASGPGSETVKDYLMANLNSRHLT